MRVFAGLVGIMVAGPVCADPLALALRDAQAFCAAQGGKLEMPEGALTAVELTGDGVMDAIVSEEGAFCGPDHGFLGGSGGHVIHAVVGGHVQSWLAGAWLVQDIAFVAEGELQPASRVLILGRHGSFCGSHGAAPCIEAVVWGGTKFISVADGSGE